MKCIFIQPRINLNHINFNASYLNNFREDNMIYYSYSKNIDIIRNKIINPNIRLVSISNETGRTNALRNLVSDCTYKDSFYRNLKKILIKENNMNTVIILLQTTPKSIKFFRDLNLKNDIIYFFHRAFNDRSSAEYFKGYYSRNYFKGSFFKKTASYIYKNLKHFIENKHLKYFIFFKTIKKNEFIIVFSDAKKQKILEYFPELNKSIRVATFFYEFNEFDFKSILQNRISEKGISIIKLGVINENKGLTFLKRVILETTNISLRWYGIGPVMPNDNLPIDLKIFCRTFKKRQIEFENEILQKKFSILLHKKEFIEEIVSGTFYDAVNYGLPILCIKNSFFERFFSNDIGYMFDSHEKMIDFLNNYSFNEDKYREQVLNILELKQALICEIGLSDLARDILD